MVKAVLLDIDGTLIDSNDAHAKSWVEALASENIQVPFEKVRPLIGMGGDRLLPAVAQIEESSSQGERISERRKKIFEDQYLTKIPAFPETRALLEKFLDHGLILTIATSAGADLRDKLLDRAGVRDLIHESVTKDDAESSKPAPDIVEAALKKSGVEPGEAIMIGDTPFDIIAATRAGVRAIGFRSGGWHSDDLKGAIAVYDGPADLLARWQQSPFV